MSKRIKLNNNIYLDAESVYKGRSSVSNLLNNIGSSLSSSFTNVPTINGQANFCGNLNVTKGVWLIIGTWYYEGENLRFFTSLDGCDFAGANSAYDNHGWVNATVIGYVNNNSNTSRQVRINVWPNLNVNVSGSIFAIKLRDYT